MDRGRAIEVFYDRECPLCRASRRWTEARDIERRLTFRDRNEPACSPAFSERPEEAMWVRLPGGEIASGFAGWLTVVSALPRWGPVARIMAIAPFRWFGPVVYRLVARHRHVLAAW